MEGSNHGKRADQKGSGARGVTIACQFKQPLVVKYDLGNKTGIGAVLSRAWLRTVNAEQPRLGIHCGSSGEH